MVSVQNARKVQMLEIRHKLHGSYKKNYHELNVMDDDFEKPLIKVAKKRYFRNYVVLMCVGSFYYVPYSYLWMRPMFLN